MRRHAETLKTAALIACFVAIISLLQERDEADRAATYMQFVRENCMPRLPRDTAIHRIDERRRASCRIVTNTGYGRAPIPLALATYEQEAP